MERFSEATLLHEAFDAQAARTPEALAVAAGDTRLTYRELCVRANRLAHHLRALGVGPEVRVGVCLERTGEMVVGLLAVLKAGGAYVPLDPFYPQDRLTYMLEDSGASVLLTESRLRHVLPAPGVRETVLLDAPGLPEGAVGPERLGPPGNLAYLIYTSGSTGRPKGVAIEHRSAVALLRWAAAEFPPEELAGVLASTSVCFDLSVFEIFVPLALGGAVIVAGNALDLPYLPADPPVTLVNTVPSALAELVRSRRVPASVRVVNLAGEALPGALVEEIYRTTSVERVLNLYGPSEDTTYSTGCTVGRDSAGAPPIGRPLPGTDARLLGPDGTPVPAGEEGEIFLSGEGLARGYLGRPELTAERFVPDPFTETPGARMYRTGDLARHLPDGQLHYLGRADHQVKIRGFRIELGEIEGALARHPAVRETAVLAEEDETAGKRLVAFLAVDGEMPGIGELRAFLGRTLPAYMMPSLFVRVDALPRTLNGKVDRRALAASGRPVEAPAVPDGLLPLSFAQQRLWFTERLRPGEPAYNEPLAWDLRGPVDRAALAAALGEIVRRHEVLRTRYVEVSGTPFQEVLPPPPFELPLVDLGGLPEAELERVLAAHLRLPFDLGRPPLLRALLVRRVEGEHTLSLAVHHIAYDGGRSRQILADELSAFYGAAREGRPSPLPPPAAQYGDFARQERESWKGIPAARLAQWRRLLEGAPALVLPGVRPRPAVRTSRGVTVRFEVPADLVAALRSFSRTEGGTLFKALFSLLAALLGRSSGRRDGVIGTTLAGRTRPGSAEAMGFFVNLLPLRVDLSGSPGLRTLLARVRRVVDEAAAAQEDLPYDQLVAALRPARGPAEAGALFEVLAQRLPTLAGPALAGLEVARRPVDTGTAKFSLEATLEENGGRLDGYLQGSADLYDAPALDRFATRFRTLLEAAVADPDRPLDEIPLPFEEETRALVAVEPVLPALPEPAPGQSTPAGEILARIWCEVLGLDSVAPGDNFFHLGGHSLLGASVLSRVRDLFGVDLPVQALFRAPTVQGLAGVLVEALRGGGRPAPPPVRPVPRGEPLPLSFAQERFWFLERLGPGSAAYNIPMALHLRGRLDEAALEAALHGIVLRHEALRTRFTEAGGRRVQEILPVEAPGLARIDLAAFPEEERRAELARISREEAGTPFDLSRPPLLRARLVRLGESEHVLLLTVHHAVFDGGSQGIVNRELSILYAAARAGRPAALPDLPVQYADFAAWQRSWLTDEVLDGLLAWWRRELEGAPALLDLPADRPRPDVRTFRGARERADLPPDGVAALARRFGATRFMVLLAAFQTLLSRLLGQEDLLVGSPSMNRPRPELETVVGLFVETLPLRGRLAGDPPFHGLLARVRETALAAFAHQDLPFERLVAGLGVERSPSWSPLVQAMFSLQDTLDSGLSLPGLAVRLLDPPTATAKLDLALVVEEEGGRLRAVLEYDTALFEAVTARRLLHRYLSLLEGASADPALRLSDLPLLSGAERHQLLAEWNDTSAPVSAEPSLLRRIEGRARRAPGALAIAEAGWQVTYGELDLRAGLLARRLRRLGVGLETRVAVCLPRSPESVAVLLAVWKAGGAYVALDPSHPADRLAAVLADSGALVLIAEGPLAARLAREGLHVLDPGAGKEEEPLAADETLDALPDRLAYVIYTSGSTGRPKGVEVGHRSLANLAAWHQAAYGVTAEDRTTLLAKVGFDASVWEIWPALAAGASLHLPDEETLVRPEALRDFLVEEGITLSFLPTPLAESLLDLPWPAAAGLRALLTGGDALRRRPAADLPFALINHYGPTEATVVSTAGFVASSGEGLPAIGRPITNARAYVVDSGLRLAPAGTPGELWIGGAGLARGYLGSPAATAERYVPDPFTAEPGARAYRTGDLVRLGKDGAIEFLGRIDRQVKLRGFRLELGEIEAALTRHPALRDAAVIVAEGGPGGRRLVAFATLRREPAPRASEIFEALRRVLPDYMIPAAFVPIGEMPLTPNGKVDRRALAGRIPEEGAVAAGALSPTEELIAQIWCQVLGLDSVGPRDGFFELGGHSLLAASVLARVRDGFGVNLPVQALFQSPTVAGLAEAVADALRGDRIPGPPPVLCAPRTGRLPLSFAQERFWFLERLNAGNAAYNIPVAFRLEGRLDPAALGAALSGIVRRHEVLRTRFAEAGGEVFQEIAAIDGLGLARIDLASLSGEERRQELFRLAREEAAAPLDLGRPPHLRARLARLGAGEHVLLLTIHHAVFDGASLGILTRDLAALYAAALGQAPLLPEPPLQYADYAVWQRAWLTDEVLSGLLAWWHRELSQAPTVLDLPADRPRPAVRSFGGALERIALPARLMDTVAAVGRSHGATRFMVLLAAFQALLGRAAGREDLLVGSPSANRPRPELEEVVGLFVETLVLRGRLGGDPTFGELLARTRETALGAFAHQDLPFERLVAGLGVERSAAWNPLVQVMFSFQGTDVERFDLPGVAVHRLEEISVSSKLDLSLLVEEAGGRPGAVLEYDTDLFEGATARRFLEAFEAVLESAAGDPARTVSELPLLIEAARLQVLAGEVETVGSPALGEVLPEQLTELVAQIWSEVLGVEEVGPRDHFFHLGGHSILGARMLSRVRESVGVDLPVRELFLAPTVDALARRIAAELKGRDLTAPPPVLRVSRDGLLPLSYAQEALWFIHDLAPESAVYGLPFAWRLSGPLDPAAFEAALFALALRHEALRTRFPRVDGRPVQEIEPAPPALRRIDLSALPAGAREPELERVAREEAGTGFDLERGPLVRAGLVTLGEREHALLLTLHHNVFDGWSVGILNRELPALYDAALSGRPEALPELPVQYADFAAWQRSWLEGETLERLLTYWRRELAGASGVLEIPTDRPRPAAQTFRGAWAHFVLPDGLAWEIRALGRRQGVTPYMTFLAGLQTLLHRLSGQDDVLTGSPVANRPRPELEDLIGYFVGTVVLRGRFGREGATFHSLLAQVRDTALGAFAHQDLPFERLVAELGVERDLSRNPLFQVMLAFEAPGEDLSLPGVSVQRLSAFDPPAMFDLSLTMADSGGGFTGALEYNVDLFDRATAGRMMERLEALLAAVAADPDRRLDDLPLLSAAESGELVAEAARTVGPRRHPRLLHELFAEQAARTPQALAVLTAEGERLTYAELRERSRRLAGFLAARGVGPEVPVGVRMERSPELIVALLGILEAGGVYLPLDPAYPEERLAFLIEDSGARLVLTPESLAGIVSLDGPSAPLAAVRPENLAYLIYTSGSTGRPKAVGVPHAGAAAQTEIAASLFGLTPEDRVLLFASPGFDVSLEEILPTLASGAAVVLRGPGLWEPATFLDRLAELGVTVTNLPTAYWHQWVAEREGAAVPEDLALRLLVLGSEGMSGEAARRYWRAPLPGVRLLNGYGPTEAIVTATAFEVDRAAAEAAGGVVAIGRPLSGRAAWVLDLYGHPAPVGVAGELVLGGPLLARGYMGRPDLSAERFVPDPFSCEPGARLYRTGDLVRRRPDGVLDFLGRIDRQVKVRGFRIELGEVEAALLRHPAVREAVADVREDGALAAWIVPAGEAPSPEDLRDFLRGALPDPMIPSAFAVLPELPLTPNGKVDRRALPAPELTRPEAEAPRDPVEEMMAALWADLLGIGRVGRDDDFFALGGHSLKATQLASRLRQAFGVDLPLRAVFEDSTPARLAARVRSLLGGDGALLPPVTPEVRPERVPLSFAQQRLWFIDRLEPDRAVYNIPMALVLDGPLDGAALEAALSGVFARHEALRTRFVEEGGQPWQEIAEPSPAALPRIDLRALPPALRAAERDRLVHEEAWRPFDLEAGPLLRGALLRLEDEEHVLLLTSHHIVSDAWSEDVLRRELSALYTGAELPELPVQYADFALWQRRFLEDLLTGQLDYWRRQLAGLSTLEIPTDRPRPPVQSFRGAYARVQVPPSVAEAWRGLARGRGTTRFMVLLAAYQTLMGRLSGQTDVAVGSPVANRNRAEIEGLIGFFVNMLAFRADLSGDPTFDGLLPRVRRMALDAYGHQDVPFERLVDELRPERDMSRQPLVQVMIALQDGEPEPLALPGVAVAPLSTGDAIAKFDLTLYLGPDGDGYTGVFEYATDLFDPSTVERMAGHLVNVLASVTSRPGSRLSEAGLLSPEEWQQVVHDWNDTRAPFPEETLLHQFFEERVDRAPGAVAAVWEGQVLTYGGLEARANRIAHLLRDRGVHRGAPVGVWMERSLDMVAAVLSVLKAGGHYLPLDAAWPADRVEGILARSGAPAILTRSAHLGPVLEMQWRLPALADVVCLDEEAPKPAPEPLDPEGVRALFDLVAERAVDRVTAGGFVSRETGLPFSEAEVDEYRDRVVGLASPFVRPEARVLEIGSGSGLILWEIAPRVSRYVGLDPSPLTQEKNRARAAELGLENVELPVGFAHDVFGWPEGSFDLVILASTVQFFPGPLYLERIVEEALRLLAPGGALLVADVPDARRKDELQRVLSLDADLFRDLGARVLYRESGFDNELRFRYDVLIEKDAAGEERPRRKSLWTSWHVERCPASRLPAVASPEDVAYVIHTSGSTGQPKGIVVQHRPVANLIHWINGAFGIGPSDRVLFVTSLCFDLSVWDVFGLLAAGGSIHVASEEDLRDAERLVRALLEEPVTVWDSAPAALVRLAPLFPAEPALQSRLRRVMLSGDWIPVTLPDRVRAAFPGAVVTSLGGATEATVWSNWYPIGPVDPRWPSIPYGRPIANARYHVLDAGLAPCPVGVPGDLYIGGDCLCVGYAHEPALTAAAFVPDPFAAEPGARLYRTGDRARFFADGNLEFLGRVDQQVKIRGFRIELGEIEVALARHPGVYEAVALAREDVPGDKRLVAYVVPPAGEAAPDAAELREHLRRDLPEYMVPSAFVALPALPVTANGKLDRRALPAPRWDQGGEEGVALPATPAEEALAALWREILGVERVGRGDDFFALGGHSLLATQLVARLRETFGVEVALRTVFQSPSLAELAATLDTLRGAASTLPPLRPVPRGGLLPVSFPQQRLWLVERLDPGSSTYNIPYAFRLRGSLEPAALAAGFSAVVRRHEALRTRFVERDGQPWQEILPAAPFVLPLVDLGGLETREEELARLGREEAARPFDLENGPLLRAGLVRLGDGEHALLLTLHHIVSDGWSEEVLLRELSALYVETPLPELPVQYADFAAWQRSWPGEVLADQLAFWTARLSGLAPLELPTDRPRPPVQTSRGGVVPVTVPAAVAAGLRALGRGHEATLFMVLLAAWQALLQRVTGQEDVAVGSPAANRNRPEVRDLVGFFVNLLPLRADFGGRPSFADLLAQVRRTALEAYDRADVPFEWLVDELRLERNLSRHPLVQSLFVLQNRGAEALLLPGVEVEPLDLAEVAAKFDLSLALAETEDGLAGSIEYNADLFDRATARRLAGHLGNLLAAVAARPGGRVEEIGLLTEAERHQLAAEWNDTAAEPAGPALLHEAFMARAADNPGAVALVHGDRRVTYGELDELSDRLAALLHGLGVGPEVRVGLCSTRTPDLVTGALGILKAGGAYVPLDPEYPRERLAFTLEDARVPVLVTQEALLPVLPEHQARVVLLDGLELSEAPAVRPPRKATADNLAYLIYTSGSTGRAKGVAIAHRSAVTLVRWSESVFPGEDLAGVLASTSICFDLSVFELFVPLSRGGTVILAANALELPRLSAAGEVTLVNTVPSAIAELVRTGGVPSSVRTVNLAGEALPGTFVDEIYARTAAARVLNLYGPSEDTTYSTFARIDPGSEAPAIGRPIHGTEAWVLDRAGRPVPLGVPGDLHLGGAGLARGYLERPDLTAERFVPDPFSGVPGGRLYRTGDLVRTRPDGSLHFLGRIDHQVKVRGFRIELGEVEAALSRHPAVREAVVMVRGEALSERHLAAWVTPRGEKPTARDLREFLKSRLPEAAVPSAFVVLDELPRTPNGKVDRRALPSVEIAEPSAPYTAPATPVGEILAEIWSALLKVPKVGGRDSFFELGGHSLLATQLLARVRETFGVDLALRAVFQAPTLDDLAATVDAARGTAPAAIAPIRPVPRDGELPLSASQLRQWFLVQLEPESADYNLPVTLRLEGELAVPALAAALCGIVQRHEALRATFVASGGRPAVVIAEPAAFPLPVVDLAALPEAAREAEAERLALAEPDRLFDLTQGPLLRATLIRLGHGDHLLAGTVHHIAFDGFSQAIFLRELAALYESAVSGRPSPLPALPVQYADYASWQRDWLESPAARAQVDHWKARLAGAPEVLDLPTDRPRPAVRSTRGEMLPLSVPAELAAELKSLAGRQGSTLFMVLLAGYAALLSRYTGQEDLNVGTFVANRRQPGLENLIGFFVNTLVLRVDLAGEPGFAGLLARVREMALDAFEHQEVPFERLLDELEIGRDLSRAPLFQVMFGVQNFETPTVEVPGLALRPATFAEHSRTGSDLAFWMWEQGDGLSGWMQWSTDLYDAATVARMFGHMASLLAAGAADPARPLSELPLLPAAEREQILGVWSLGEARPEPARLVHERMREQARRAPEVPAAVLGGRILFYGDLTEHAGRVARGLRDRGVGPETVVGLCIDRTPEMLVALYGILGSGAAYLPLDPKLPAERMAALLADSGAGLVLSRKGLADVLPPLPARTLFVDADFEGVTGEGFPEIAVAPENAAYVLYTSGSTGMPKGVVIEHRALAAFTEAALGMYGIGPRDRVLQFASLSFDTSVEEIYPCLSAGGTLVLRDEEMLASPAFFLATCDRLGVTVLDLPTAYWHELAAPVAAGSLALPSDLRLVILGGERALPERVRGWLDAVGSGPRMVNTYGPTEATVVATACDLGETAPEVPIGRPIPGREVWLLDQNLRPVPAGVPGEICLGGQGLARGYLGRPDLTAERFVPSPFGPPGARLYRTGDLGRWLPSGQIDFAGRADGQVKIRGFRVEPGEIEAALARHPAVREAVVVAREVGPGERRLAAYAVPVGEEPPAAAELRAFLKDRLPVYMVPADVVLLPALPLTRTGKVDRRALPDPERAAPADEGYAPPETATEEILAGLWQELLGLPRVGIYDDFFDLGGHSLLAPQVLSRIADVFEVELPLRTLFEAPTVAQMAVVLEQVLLAQIEELSDEEAASLIDQEVG